LGFTKLDEGILKSSIMAETAPTFKVWIALLASCDYDGIARVSPIFLSAACHLSQPMTDKALDILSSPDKYSRSDADEGRRIRNIDGGYFVINYLKYRAFTYSDSPSAIRQRRHREKERERDAALRVTMSRDISASASASVINKSNKEEEKNKGGCFFNFETSKWEGITDADKSGWSAAYPACDIDVELNRMAEWLKANPEKRKVRYRRFITNWLARAQDRGGTKGGGGDYRPFNADDDKAAREMAKKIYERQKAREGEGDV